MKAFNVRLTEEVWTDLLTMAKFAGKPNNLAAGFYAMVAEWHRLKAAGAARPTSRLGATLETTMRAALEAVLDDIGTAENSIPNSLSMCTRGMVRAACWDAAVVHDNRLDRAAQIAQQEEQLDALDRRAEAEGHD